MDDPRAGINVPQLIDYMSAIKDQLTLDSGHRSISKIFILNTIHDVFEIANRTGKECR